MSDRPTIPTDAPSPAPAAPKQRHPPRIPPVRVWVICGVLIGIIVWLRWGSMVGDHAIVNVATFVLSFLVLSVLVGWFIFLSGYGRWPRTVIGLSGLAAVTLFFICFEIHQVSGELVPGFRYRFAPQPDELLDVPAATAAARADLATTTEFDFPQFLGPRRNAHVDAVRLERDWGARPPKLLWRQPIGAGWSGFSAVNGFAVTMEQRGSEELVTCYQISSGQLVWSCGTTTRHSTLMGGVGPRSTPTIDDGRVYALGATGHLLCLDGRSGEVIWRDNLLQRYGLTEAEDGLAVAWGRASSPLIVDDLLIVPAGGTDDGPRHSLVAFRKADGALVWQSGDRQVSYSSPVLGTLAGLRQIVSVNEDTVSGHDPQQGDVLWNCTWPGQSNADANNSQPVLLDGDRVLVTKGYGAGAMMLRLSTSAAAVQVEELWRNQRVLKTKFTNVVVRDEYAYGLSDGILECVSMSDGERQWKRGRYYQGQILGVGDLLLVQAESGEIALVEASPSAWNELARIPALEGKTWNNLCLYGPFLLARNAEQACCFELPLAASGP